MTENPQLHENPARRGDVKAGSEKSFGVVFAVVFAVIGLWPLADGGAARIWALGAAAAFLACGFLLPAALRPLNRAWLRFGLLLHKIVSPLIMGLLFYAAVTPTGVIMRLMGKDPLRLSFDRNAATYWIERRPPGPPPESMKNQF